MLGISACIFALAVSALLVAQQTHTGSGSEEGKQLFVANCAPCHGPDGDAIAGVDFGRGKFRRVSSDGDVLEIVKAGIPGTAPRRETTELVERREDEGKLGQDDLVTTIHAV